ncbi:HNH endonuclease signature motif containing protein [Aquabacterium humicola]|uniref:HNH endonuclease signature motif containing protein n=1 Tax=Aquabacterium humicola TaxID=3237377 RepID=UPI002542FBA0|nr:HNH endonuclease signature motif containing protein [Rubrivivax pictus]
MPRRLRSVLFLAFVASASALPADRSRTLRAEFQRLHPCPSTGATHGPCPGYHVDHIEALVCGGRDELRNLQWLAIGLHKEKTRAEVKLCRAR